MMRKLSLLAILLAASAPQERPAGEWEWVKTPQPTGVPGLCFESAAAFDRSAGKLVLFGGHGLRYSGSERCDTWLYCPRTNAWEKAEPANRPVGSCCVKEVVYDEANRRSYFFGGHSHAHGWQWRAPRLRSSNPWAYDASANTWLPMKPSVARPRKPWTGAAYDEEHQAVVTYGGEGFPDTDVWVYDGYANTWTALKRQGDGPGSGGRCPPMAYDPDRRKILMYGKGDPESKAQDRRDGLWLYDLATNSWTARGDTEGPTRRGWPLMVYDPQNRGPVLFGGDEKGTLKAFAYRWEKNEWSELPARGEAPPAYTVQQGAYDPEGHRTIFANGGTYNVKNQPGTFVFRHAAAETGRGALARPSDVRVVAGPGRAEVAWRPVQGAARYVVYKGTGEAPWSVSYRKAGEVREPPFVDAGVAPAAISWYFVRAVDEKGLESPPSLKVRTQARAPREPVVSVLAADQVEISWERSAEPDVAGYNVYRGTTKLNDAPLRETAFLDGFKVPDSGEPVRYTVRAVNALGVESGPSPWAASVPTEPTGLRARREGTEVVVTWRANPQKKLQGYTLYRLDSAGGKEVRKIAGPLTATRFVDASKADDAPCKYYLTAVDALGQEGFASYGAWFNDDHGR
jgi:hypothetical protein